jgi:hypothetical protein
VHRKRRNLSTEVPARRQVCKKHWLPKAANGSANMFSRIRMEGYQTLDGRSKSLAIGKTSKPPVRRSRARGFVGFFIAAETYYNSRSRLLQFVCRTETENSAFTSKKGVRSTRGQGSTRLDLQKPNGAITQDELQKALLHGVTAPKCANCPVDA